MFSNVYDRQLILTRYLRVADALKIVNRAQRPHASVRDIELEAECCPRRIHGVSNYVAEQGSHGMRVTLEYLITDGSCL